MKIQNTYDLNIYIDGMDITSNSGCMFVSAKINEDISTLIPTCELRFTMSNHALDEVSIVDGATIIFDIEANTLNFKERLYFRLYQMDLKLEQEFANIRLIGLLDFYDGYKHTNAHNLYGSSSDVFNDIVNKYKLKAEIDQTNDYQLWVAGEDNLYAYMSHVANAGWIDNTSGMFWCMDRHKILLYKNISSMFRNDSKQLWTFLQQNVPNIDEKIFVYSNAISNIESGKENLIYEGYGGEDHYFDLLSYDWKEAVSRKVVAESNLVNINKSLSRGLSQTWYPFDVGNFHKNYYNAIKQNKRVLSTFSTYVTLESQFFMNYRLCQIVNFVHMDSQNLSNSIRLTSGKYIIKAIEIDMTPSKITSSLKLAMQGLNGKAVTQEVY